MKYRIHFFFLFLSIACCFSSCRGDLFDDVYKREIPSYFESSVNECVRNINQELSHSQSTTTLVYITDTHWGNNYRNSPSIVKRIFDETDIDLCVFGGDAIAGCYLDKYEAIKWGEAFLGSFSFFGERFLAVYGNHDDNRVEQIEAQEILIEKEVHGFLQRQMESSNLCYGGYYYFYYDDAKCKTRFIGLDTGLFDISVDEWGFLVKALASTSEGWHIVMVTHELINLWGQQPIYVKNILSLLDAYNARKKGVLNYGGNQYPYDYTDCKGRVEFCLGGHVHKDVFFRSNGGIPCVITDCDAKNTDSGIPATPGTINEQCVTAIVADYEHNLLHCNRVGRGDSKDYIIKE